jgi:exosortase/archaeosortase family protein
MIPMPAGFRTELETFLQYGSAAAANWMFTLSGLSVFQDNLSFHLPGNIRFNVEPECSGIHSSLVLLITSLVAGHLLLRTWWKQAVLVVVVIPLALLRNGFRIFVIGRLCVHFGARMFDSWVHHRGGPLFFAISLVPFFGLLLWLVKSERTRPRTGPKPVVTTQS